MMEQNEKLDQLSKSDPRKLKRNLNWYHKHAGWGKYLIDCRYHPCRVTACEWEYWDLSIQLVSLINDKPFGCSALHCGLQPISRAKAEEMAEYAKMNGFDPYLKKYLGFTDADLARFDRLAEGFDKGEI